MVIIPSAVHAVAKLLAACLEGCKDCIFAYGMPLHVLRMAGAAHKQ